MRSIAKWLGLAVSALVITSMALLQLTAVNAASAHHVSKHAARKSAATKCAKRNKASGIVTFSDTQFPDTMNPAQTDTVVDVENEGLTGDSLFYYNNKAQLKPQMATIMPTTKNGGITNGGKTYTIHLKKGLKWSNGTPLTAKDFVFGWKVASDKASGPACTGSCDVITRIDTPNAYTLVMHLKQPVGPFLNNGDYPPAWPTSWPGGWSNDPHSAALKLYQDTSFNFEGPNYPTNGAYQVASFVNNDRITYKPMKYYTDMNCGGYVKEPIFAFYSSKAGLIAAAATHQTDVTQDYTSADLPLLQKSHAYTTSVVPAFSIEHLELNSDPTYNGQPNPLHNANVRLAIALALDKLGIVRSALSVSAASAKSVEAWTFQLATKALKGPFADTKLQGQWDPITHKFVAATGSGAALADAKKLLSRTQWKNGFTLDYVTTTNNPSRAATLSVVTANLARLGIKVNGNEIPSSKLFGTWNSGGTLQHGQFQMADLALSASSPDMDGWKYNMQSQYRERNDPTHAVVDENESGIDDALINREFNAGFTSVKKSARANAYAAIQTEVNKMAYWIPLYFRPSIVTWDSHAKNVTNTPLDYGPEWNAFNWKAAS